MAERMAFAVAGYGAWGRFHASSIAGCGRARLAAIAAHGEDSAAAAKADHPSAVVYREWEDILRNPEIEAVAVATPNHLHAPIAIAALNAGKHVLLEKPMATTLADCDRIVAAAARSKAQITIGLQCRLSPLWGRIRELIDQDAIGAVEHVHVSLFRHPYRQGAAGWRYDKARVGSWILEEPVHFFDLALWYLPRAGRPVSVQAIGAGEPGMQSTLSVLMRFANGATAAVNQVLAGFEHHHTVEVVGAKGAVRATWSAATARSLKSATSLKLKRAGAETFEELGVEPAGEVYELAKQVEAAIDGFRSGKPLVSADEGRAAVAVCLAAEASAADRGRAKEVD